jgi:sugar lactone lactonase YvrE
VSAERDGWTIAVACACELGERPVWDPLTATLWWVDVLTGGLHSLHPTRGHRTTSLEVALGTVGLRTGGGVVAASAQSIVLLDADGLPDADPIAVDFGAGLRFNDGAVDPAGRLIVGTTATDGRRHAGALYAVEATGAVRVLLDAVTESNGVGWSPDGSILYYVDSGEQAIRTYAYDPEAATLRDRADLTVIDESSGVPDGLVVDAEGAIWVALWGGAAVRRYAPDGTLLSSCRTPVSQPTCPAFGPDGVLYLTTAWEGIDASARDVEPWAGHLLQRPANVAGQPAARFAG